MWRWVCHGVSMLLRVWVDCRRTHDEEPLSLPILTHADNVVRRRRFAFPKSAQPSSLNCVSCAYTCSCWTVPRTMRAERRFPDVPRFRTDCALVPRRSRQRRLTVRRRRRAQPAQSARQRGSAPRTARTRPPPSGHCAMSSAASQAVEPAQQCNCSSVAGILSTGGMVTLKFTTTVVTTIRFDCDSTNQRRTLPVMPAALWPK